MLLSAAGCALALLLWWGGTRLILELNHAPRRHHPVSMLAATGFLVAALIGIARLRTQASPAGALLAFGCAIVVWGWLEMSFLLGYITGPRRTACPEGCGGWAHFRHALEAILYHELALLAALGVAAVLSYPGPNRTALWALLILWGMRASAKLNLFLGVRNPGSGLLPPRLQYLTSFFRQRPMNALFPFSIAGCLALLGWLVAGLLAARLSAFQVVEGALLLTLSALGLLEHGLLVLTGTPPAPADPALPRAAS